MSPALPQNPVFCALDTVDVRQALEWARAVKPYVGGLKLGMEFFNANGPEGVKQIKGDRDHLEGRTAPVQHREPHAAAHLSHHLRQPGAKLFCVNDRVHDKVILS